MGEYRGLVKPYSDGKKNSAKIPSTTKIKRDLYSQYDDDVSSASQNYFYLPGRYDSMDVYKFKEAFVEMNRGKIVAKEQNHRSQQQQHRHTNSISTHSSQTQHKWKLHPLPPVPSSTEEGGDYCLIKSDRPVYQNYAHYKNEKNLTKKNTAQTLSSTTVLALDSMNIKTPIRVTPSNVDYRTCSSCVRMKIPSPPSSYNQSTTIEDDDVVDFCGNTDHASSCHNDNNNSTTTTTSHRICRYICMGVLTLFLPCVLCYSPSKSCRNCSTNNTTRQRRRTSSTSKLTFNSSNDNNSEKLLS